MKHVLLVEDDPILKRAMQRFLKGNKITAVSNVQTAVALLRGITFDAVVTDYDLEGTLTGGDLIQWIRNHQSNMLAKTIVFSANPDAERIHTNVISKPHIKDLTAALAAL